jgi:hypothetical protein
MLARGFGVVERNGEEWVRSFEKFVDAVRVAKMFKRHGNLALILDKKDSRFLKGVFLDGRALGERIGVLPDGTKLDKAFPLFARDLVVHDERSEEHWDVIFRNVSGAFCYVYSVDKVLASRDRKFRKVEEFERVRGKLRRNLLRHLDDVVALAIVVLLETKIRVGSEVYYKRTRHRGLSTLKKRDVRVVGDRVVFDFVGKDGVPQRIEKKFSGKVVDELKRLLVGDGDGFLFVKSGGGLLRDSDFEAGFERFCGVRFYPHIVRSAFATRETEKFFRRHEGGVGSRERVRDFYLWLAEELGHKKFSWRKQEWEACYEVTLHHYVRPDLVERMRLLGKS